MTGTYTASISRVVHYTVENTGDVWQCHKFRIFMNFTKSTILTILLPLFIENRTAVYYGSHFCRAVKTRGWRTQLESIVVIGLVIVFLKTKDPSHRLRPIFGVVPRALQTWLDFGMEVALRIVRRDDCDKLLITSPRVSQIKESTEV